MQFVPNDRIGCGFRLALALSCILAGCSVATAHDGRRFTIEVVNNKLQAQGINNGPDDGAPFLRPYLNSLHDHFGNAGDNGAFATLPGFDVPQFTFPLIGHDLNFEWTSVSKWVNPPLVPGANTVPNLQPLAADEEVTVVTPANDLSSGTLGSFPLTENIPLTGAADLDLVYVINKNPVNEIYLLQFVMSATPSDGSPTEILPSDPVYVTLAPDGATAEERLHLAARFLEAYVVSVPEPATASLCLGLLVLGLRFRRAA